MGTNLSFEKVGECLYRNPASGTYYALVKVRGKQIKSSLETKNLLEARRKLKDYRKDIGRIDPSAGKITMEGLADRYLATVQHQAVGTVAKKKAIVERIKARWGALPAKSLQKSQVLAWLASFKFGMNSRNKHLRVIRAMYRLGADERLLASSPVDGVKEGMVEKPIRQTPSLAEFQAIVDSIRTQPFADTREESADFVEFLGLAGLGLAQWQGHRDGGKLILDTYSHVRPAHSERMAALMTLEKPVDALSRTEVTAGYEVTV